MNQPNIDAILKDRGHITVGRGGVECVAAASSSYVYPVIPVRRDGEDLAVLPNLN